MHGFLNVIPISNIILIYFTFTYGYTYVFQFRNRIQTYTYRHIRTCMLDGIKHRLQCYDDQRASISLVVLVSSQ